MVWFMRGRELLRIAAKLAGGSSPSEPAERSAVNRAYYAAFLEALDYIHPRGFLRSPGRGSHNRVWNFLRSGIGDPDRRRRELRRTIADTGIDLKRRRQEADYRPHAKMPRGGGKEAVAEANRIIKELDALIP
jgi:hypothetical protein